MIFKENETVEQDQITHLVVHAYFMDDFGRKAMKKIKALENFNFHNRKCLFITTDHREKFLRIFSDGHFVGDNIWENKERYSISLYKMFIDIYSKAEEIYKKSNLISRFINNLCHKPYKFSVQTTNLLFTEILNTIRENQTEIDKQNPYKLDRMPLNVFTVENFNEMGLAKIITYEDRHYWVDTAGHVVSEPAAHVVTDKSGFRDYYALVNKSGKTVIPFRVYNNLDFSIMENHDGTAFVAEREPFEEAGDFIIGLIDDKGKEIVPFGYYDSIVQSCYIGLPEGYILPYEFGENTYFVAKGDSGSLINDKGERINYKRWHTVEDLLMQFAVPVTYTPTLTPMCNDEGKYGYVNHENELIIPYQYSYAREFQNGFAMVSDSEGVEDIEEFIWYHIDETGKELDYTIKYDENGEIDSK
jgi:hypothetical protein